MLVGVPNDLVTILQATTHRMREGWGREGREGKGGEGKGREGKGREGKSLLSGKHKRHLLRWQLGPHAQRDQLRCGLQCYKSCMHAGMRPQ